MPERAKSPVQRDSAREERSFSLPPAESRDSGRARLLRIIKDLHSTALNKGARERMEAEAEIFEPFDLHYSDLLLLSSAPSSSPSSCCASSAGDVGRLEALTRRVMGALGRGGPGLLCVSGVPSAPALRRALLPLARRLALLRPPDRSRILKIHGLGTDVPLKNLDRMVSSFALQLKYPVDQSSGFSLNGSVREAKEMCNVKENIGVDQHDDSWEDEFQMLGCTFRQLGLSMMDLGLCVARICDRAIGNQELENSILESCSAKGRLIHYHSAFDNIILKEMMKKTKGNINKKAGSHLQSQHMTQKAGDRLPIPSENRVKDVKATLSQFENTHIASKTAGQKASLSSLWQEWHYDYGTFTILTAPMFLLSHEMLTKVGSEPMPDDQECCSPDNHTYLQLFVPTKNKIFLVKSSPDSFIVQIGEAADILSRGELCSTLHSVGKLDRLEKVSRETFVVFLQPSWDKKLFLPEYPEACRTCQEQYPEEKGRNGACTPLTNKEFSVSQGSEWLKQEILKSVPPLSSRLRGGMTFAEFSKETTRQYYGGSGVQSQK